jgi:predicted acyltransferase
MAKWARHPPSDKRVKLVFGIVAICLIIAGLEWLGVFPDFSEFAKRPRIH